MVGWGFSGGLGGTGLVFWIVFQEGGWIGMVWDFDVWGGVFLVCLEFGMRLGGGDAVGLPH